jgi:4-hydroxybenzoate polyprenyltransferase
MRVKKFIADMLLIRRVEFRIAEIPILAIPVLLNISDSSPFRTFLFWEGVFLFFLLFAFGDMINCLADRDLDAIYKQRLSRAVYDLGVRFVTFQVVASAVVAIAIAAHLSWMLDRWLLLLFVVGGLALGAAYSVEPVRLKGRGVAQLVCLLLVIFVGPMLFAELLVGPRLSASVVSLAFSFGVLQMGIILVNTAEDYPEDLEAGIQTTIVSLGLRRGIALGFWMALVGAGALIATLVAIFRQAGLGVVPVTSLVTVVAACAFAIHGVWRVSRSVDTMPLGEAVLFTKQEAKKVPLWLTAIAWTTLAASIVLFFARR